MFFTVEPMINAGRYEVKILSDGWTAVTKDRSLSAQFERTIGVTATGYEIFTISPTGLHRPPYPVSVREENRAIGSRPEITGMRRESQSQATPSLPVCPPPLRHMPPIPSRLQNALGSA